MRRQILGTLDANGRVVLINGNGVLFGKNATGQCRFADRDKHRWLGLRFLSGKFTQAGKQNAAIVNQRHDHMRQAAARSPSSRRM